MGPSIVRACMVLVGLVVGLDGVGPWEARAGGMMYWTDLGISKIQRVNLDGTGLRDLVATDLRLPRSIAIDEAGHKIYWVDSGTRKIQRAKLDGSGVEDLVITYSGGPAKGGGQRYGLALATGR